MLVHTVLFWLKSGMTAEEKVLFKGKLEALQGISCAEAVYVGTPAETDRPVIDRSYDYCLTVLLKDMPAHDAYQVDSLHTDFLEHCKVFFEKVLIYDAD